MSQGDDEWSELTILLMPFGVKWTEEDTAAVLAAAVPHHVKTDHNEWVARVDLGTGTAPGAYYTFVKRLKESNRFTPVLLNYELALVQSQGALCPALPTTNLKGMIDMLEISAANELVRLHGRTSL
eukprot:TRINITY_DN66535_c0_g1_i1.p3 TRINITY_DN66535_c0_g1~~TRINITY_DN66535_c0_g1_i1.p3  ORF type:complete len:126 (+),score=35.80 TRINITY_DN66535_c0_g1_i1:104-481(+)